VLQVEVIDEERIYEILDERPPVEGRQVGAPKATRRIKAPDGKVVRDAKVDLFHEWTRAARIDRTVRWHDLRHTCPSSLVAGWWGRRWSLEEVREMLGYSSVLVTEKYAHFADSAIDRAARQTQCSEGSGSYGWRFHSVIARPQSRATSTC
jgi:integrase